MSEQEIEQKSSKKGIIISLIIGILFFGIIILIPSKKKKENTAVIHLLDEIEVLTSKLSKLKESDKDEKIELKKQLLAVKKELKDERSKQKTEPKPDSE